MSRRESACAAGLRVNLADTLLDEAIFKVPVVSDFSLAMEM